MLRGENIKRIKTTEVVNILEKMSDETLQGKGVTERE